MSPNTIDNFLNRKINLEQDILFQIENLVKEYWDVSGVRPTGLYVGVVAYYELKERFSFLVNEDIGDIKTVLGLTVVGVIEDDRLGIGYDWE